LSLHIESSKEEFSSPLHPNKFKMSEITNKDLTLRETITYVRKFHESFRITNRQEPSVDLSEKEILLRFNLMKEENEEYMEAAQRGDLVEIADALGDMLYILCGTINAHGLQDKMADIFEEIQRSNMSKLDENGQPIYREDGKVLKSSKYFKPDIKSILGR
jgi:predicted HAD superfamily Cof-like phosphohydrolase